MEQITLKAARITAGFTLREVGKKLNRSFQTIAKYEKKRTKIERQASNEEELYKGHR